MKPSDVELIARYLEGRAAGLDDATRQRLAKAFRDDHAAPKDGTHLEVASILSNRTKEGMVEVMLNRERTQMDLPKAREVRGMLDGAIEAAVSDQLLYQFLRDRIGMTEEIAGRALLDFRELRQGSRSTVFPQ
jgi:hypothetical protein